MNQNDDSIQVNRISEIRRRMKDQSAQLEQLRGRVEHVLGKTMSQRLIVFNNGTIGVMALWRAVFAWFIDFAIVTGLSALLGYSYYATHLYQSDVIVGAELIGILAMIILPFFYGWFYANGRGIGAVIAGTQLVRTGDGSMIGLGKAGWAMFGRLYGSILNMIGILGGYMSDVSVRTSIDLTATQKLHDAGYVSLDS